MHQGPNYTVAFIWKVPGYTVPSGDLNMVFVIWLVYKYLFKSPEGIEPIKISVNKHVCHVSRNVFKVQMDTAKATEKGDVNQFFGQKLYTAGIVKIY